MCGINGVVWQGEAPANRRDLIQAMNDVLQYRGPDDAGMWQGRQADLGHRRLSVIDTSSASHQPMVSADGNVVVVFNGEIYNYRALRAALEGLGRVFRTEGDTEVLLEGFATWGTDVFRRCNGMFAAAFYDCAAETLILVRDRLGIKPLYFAACDRHIAFSSEIAPLLQPGLADTTLDPAAMEAYFQYLYTPGTATFYHGIRQLEPGTLLIYSDGQCRIETYWKLRYAIDPAWTLDSASERLDELLTESVRLRERSDVPLGAFLSGGLDSSSVVTALCRARSTPVKTFSIGFDEPEANELDHARLVARHFQTDHTEAILRPDLASLLPEIARHFSEPFADSSALPMWLVSQLAREQVTVVLSGDGGDELFAGYTWAHMNAKVARYRRIPQALRQVSGVLLRCLPDTPRFNRFRRFHKDSFLEPMRSFQRRLSTFDDAMRSSLIRAEFAVDQERKQADYFDQLCDESSNWSESDRMLYLDSRMYLPGDILTKVDRMSMAHGLEARVPLLDHHIVEFAATLPFSLKFCAGQSKRPLKHLMRDRLPPQTLAQRKRGFSLPIDRWLRGALVSLFHDAVLTPHSACGEYLDQNLVQTLWKDHQRGRENHGHRLWSILMFELWLRWRRGQ